MKKTLLTSVKWLPLGLAVFGSLHCGVPGAKKPADVAEASVLVDSGALLASGTVGVGDTQPILARTTGNVRKLFFAPGEYVHRGQLLVKLFNHGFVVAPRSGFVGACLTEPGQFVKPSSPITTISVGDNLLITVAGSELKEQPVKLGDSVEVWAGPRHERAAVGVVSLLPDAGSANATLEIKVPLRSPFRIGEEVQVKLSNANPLVRDVFAQESKAAL